MIDVKEPFVKMRVVVSNHLEVASEESVIGNVESYDRGIPE